MPQKRKTTRSSVSSRTQPKGIRHHAKRIWHVTPKFVHGAVAGAFIGIVTVMSLGMVTPASALSIDTPRDCDDYAIIRCGSVTTNELQRDYKKSGVADVYSHFGISAKDIAAMDSTAVKGTIYDDGKIKVAGKTVATDAVTASWLSVNGSNKVKNSGTTFYVRHLKVSWSHKSAPAYVVMKNGEFDFAILASCGNPVIADAIPAPAPKPKPKPVPKPVPQTPVTSTKPKPTPTTPTPEQPIITPPELAIEPSDEPIELPAAGPGAVAIVAVASVVGGFLTHHTHRHLKRRHATRSTRSLGKVGHSAIKSSIRRR